MFYYVPYPALQVPAMSHAYPRTPMTFPPVDAHSFQRAAKESARLVADASLITQQISSSLSFAQRIMEAAERSDSTSVIRMLKQIGVKSGIDIRFSPEGIRIYLSLTSSRIFLLLQWA
ncbi:inner spore coat protein [Bacillus pumilus]|uniref:inner spore coat protein n=1 Tax=Bacillus pumilus TaxID=1408 RepID=UPI001CF947F9|nr:inner spore coat protein [Bacillus pumilus]UCZ70217.1 inner spore coat protein [Bacillus pumilus]